MVPAIVRFSGVSTEAIQCDMGQQVSDDWLDEIITLVNESKNAQFGFAFRLFRIASRDCDWVYNVDVMSGLGIELVDFESLFTPFHA